MTTDSKNTNPELLLQFDINGTITVHDSTEKGSYAQQANMFLARNKYGTIVNNTWTESKGTAEKGSISYYNYLKLTTDKYKDLAFVFTDEKQPGSAYKKECEELSSKFESFLLPSFVKVLETYKTAKIVFRTFGDDANILLEKLKEIGYNNKFVCGNIGHDAHGGIILKMNDGNEYKGCEKINEFIVSCPHNIVIRDDYQYWNSNKKSSSCGKPFIVNNKKNMLELFFDDNDCVICVDCKGKPIYTTNSIKVDMKAILDDNYYVNIIAQKLKEL